jgi:hypothetical protein
MQVDDYHRNIDALDGFSILVRVVNENQFEHRQTWIGSCFPILLLRRGS